jgi:hypothetical protein
MNGVLLALSLADGSGSVNDFVKTVILIESETEK